MEEPRERPRDVHSRDRRWGQALAFSVVCSVIGFLLGDSYIGRLPHHAAYYLVAVEDEVRVPIPSRPRHTAFIVVDGLRRDFAEKMSVTRELERMGQCCVSNQGSFTVSRPEYALLSTGLEVDRTGSRNNDLTAPLAAESIWEVARESGLRVSGSSHLPWFQQLFPKGFDRFSHRKNHIENVFSVENGELLDVNLFHPLYVDENAHQHGASSPEYAAAVTRVDGEIAGLLARMDLTQDLVVLTADHGHRDEGGHGGAQPEIRNVLLCFAGANVAPRAGRAELDGRSTAASLAILIGVRFPRNMRAGEDGLDAIWDIARTEPSNEAYLKDRKLAVDQFREQNRIVLERWLGSAPGTWSRLYERETQAQTLRVGLALLLAFIGTVAAFRERRMSAREIRMTVAWLAFAALAIWSLHHLVLGDFDFTVINLRERFLPRAFAISFVSGLLAISGHVFGVRNRARMAGDFLMLTVLILYANVIHIVIYGWPIGFPLPSPAARYFPFFGAIALVSFGIVTALVIGSGLGRFSDPSPRGAPTPPRR